ncbi:MAG: xanthine dehydrogenase family protein [Rhizobiales bacterium]|nr:xanthine dehydrogenase family protein [Hyphomicrobiales bacterium]
MTGFGARANRLEDLPLLTGRGRFAADVSFPGQLHMRIVRSPIASGRLTSLDIDEASSLPGVAAIWTGEDTADVPLIDFRQVEVDELRPYRQPVLARGTVRYVGEPVAAVFAEEAALAEDAAELIFPDIEPLDPDIIATGTPGEFAPGLTNAPAIIEKAYGDLDAAFSIAPHHIEIEVSVGRHSGIPLETRGIIARHVADTGMLEVYGAAKIPHLNRDRLAQMLGIEPGGMHLYEGHVGGGFGIRGEIYPEDVLACLAALCLARPVKWIEDRFEHLIAANHSRDQTYRMRAAVDDQGKILGLDVEFWHDQGAYVRTHAATVPDLSCAMLPGPYVIPAYRARGHVRITNKTPAGTYRAPGRYESTFARERLIDAIAHELNTCADAIRRANFIGADKIPFSRGIGTLGTGIVYDSADFAGLLGRFDRHFGRDAMRRDIEARRAKGEWVGFGLGYFVEKSGLGPFGIARVTLLADGEIEVVTGAASVGQGIETSLAQICAEVIPAPLEDFSVIHGQTDRIAEGRGAFASRVTVMTGSAVHICAQKLRKEILAIAGRLLQSPPDELAIADGRIARASETGGPSVTLAQIAAAGAGEGAALSVEDKFLCDHMTYPYGIHGALVVIDQETGEVTVERLLVAYDIGRAVNPVLVEGQIAGGAAQGIGGALFEEFVYDEAGQPLAATFADYLIPTSREMQPLRP